MKTQQQQCYAAQGALERGRSFTSIPEVQRFVDDLRDTPWWHAQHFDRHVLRIEVDHLRSTKFEGQAKFDKSAQAGLVSLTERGLCMRTVLHEVAHVLAVAVHGSQSHDPWWARTYLTLVSCVMGPEAYLALRRGFDAFDVDYDVKTTQGHAIAL